MSNFEEISAFPGGFIFDSTQGCGVGFIHEIWTRFIRVNIEDRQWRRFSTDEKGLEEWATFQQEYKKLLLGKEINVAVKVVFDATYPLASEKTYYNEEILLLRLQNPQTIWRLYSDLKRGIKLLSEGRLPIP